MTYDIQLLTNFEPKLLSQLQEPIWSVKHDGICVYTTESGAFTRSGKKINNPFLQKLLDSLPSGLQGEICHASDNTSKGFKTATSLVMTKKISLDAHHALLDQCKFVVFNVFGDQDFNLRPYVDRLSHVDDIALAIPFVTKVILNELPTKTDPVDLAEKVGGEGIVVTCAKAPYFNGRSKLALKVKNLDSCEGKVVRFEEEFYGEGKTIPEHLKNTPKGQARNLILYNDRFGEFTCGTGLSQTEKIDIYTNFEANWLGKDVTVAFMPVEGKGKPRMPRYIGIREDL